MNIAIVRQSLVETAKQAPVLFMVIIQSVVVAFIAFGVTPHYELGNLVSVDIFGKQVFEMQSNLVVRELTNSIISGFAAFSMFLFIIGSSNIYPELLRHPLLGIILSKAISRRQLYFSKFMGVISFLVCDFVLFGVLVTGILYVKSGGILLTSPIVASLSFGYECLVVFALCSLLSIVLENPSSAAVLGIILYFILGPLLALARQTASNFLAWAGYALPPMSELAQMTKRVFAQEGVDPWLMGLGALYVIVYLVLASWMFQRREFS